ncbi:MAG: AAA family ATPase [Elusimicrobiota bacterium]|jgi:predicted ATP-dependent protease
MNRKTPAPRPLLLLAALLLLCPSAAWTQAVVAPAPVNASLAPVVAAGNSGLLLPRITPGLGQHTFDFSASAALPGATPVLTAVQGPAVVTSAASAASVQPTALGPNLAAPSFLAGLLSRGLKIPATLSSRKDIQAFREAVSTLPQGGSRARLLAFADALEKHGGEKAVSVLFDEDGTRSAGERMPSAAAPKAQGVWAGLANAFKSKYALLKPVKALLPFVGEAAERKAEAGRLKAVPLPETLFSVAPEKLSWRPDADALPDGTAALSVSEVPAPGQEEALEAIRVGVAMPGNDYNVLVTGPEGSGRMTAVRRLLAGIAAERPTPPDVAALSATDDLRGRPVFLSLPPGTAPALEAAFTGFFEQLVKGLPGVVSGGETEEARLAAVKRLDAGNSARRAAFDEEVAKIQFGPKKAFGIEVEAEGDGITLYPTREGASLTDEQIEKIKTETPELWAKIEAEIDERGPGISDSYRDLALEEMKAKKALDAEIRALQEAAAARFVETLSAPMLAPLEAASSADAALAADTRHAVEELRRFFRQVASQYPRFMPSTQEGAPDVRPLYEYAFSVLSTHAPGSGAPVVFESMPSFPALFGYAEPKAPVGPDGQTRYGGADLLKFAGGSWLQASGGYLVLRLEDLLMHPDAWMGLVEALRFGRTNVVQSGDFLDGTQRMPKTAFQLPADVKVVLIGSPLLASILAENDESVGTFFRASARFESAVKAAAGTLAGYAQVFKDMVAAAGGELLELSRGALSEVLRYAAVRAERGGRVSTELSELRSLMKEASHAARTAGRPVVEQTDVAEVLRVRRGAGHMQKVFLEEYTSGIMLVATVGAVVGQVNGLAVVEAGDASFGSPMRMSATVSPGSGQFVSVDRDGEFTGGLFNKANGVVRSVLGRLLGGAPLPDFTVSIEQNYGPIDGDSATQAVTVAALSALSGVPLRQGRAVTGSADQFGNIQAVGGVREKVSGFFALAKARGLDGTQGVIIPVSNVSSLILDDEITAAMREGKFHIWAVEHVSQTVELLTGEAYSEVLLKARRRAAELAAQARS